jgi:hypothetical protein
MAALQRAYPNLASEKLLAKAHAQLALELIRKEEGWTYPSEWVGDDCLDLNRENRRHFWKAYSIYRRKYKWLGRLDEKAAQQIAEFERWRKYRGLGLDGKIVSLSFSTKVAVGKAFGCFLPSRSGRDH